MYNIRNAGVWGENFCFPLEKVEVFLLVSLFTWLFETDMDAMPDVF
jgi:hypothetical protein